MKCYKTVKILYFVTISTLCILSLLSLYYPLTLILIPYIVLSLSSATFFLSVFTSLYSHILLKDKKLYRNVVFILIVSGLIALVTLGCFFWWSLLYKDGFWGGLGGFG